MPDLLTTEYHVSGMTSSHCENAGKQEVSALETVVDVQVDVPTGRVTVTSTTPLDDSRYARRSTRRATNSPAEHDVPPPSRKTALAADYYGLAYSVAKGSQGHAAARGS